MEAMEILDALGSVQDGFIVQTGQFRQRRPKRRNVKRMWLIAAIIAVTTLLVGCTAAILWLQDRSIGTTTYTQRFDSDGHYITPTEKTADIVTLFGSGGSNMQKALAEWYAFLSDHPNHWEVTPEYDDIPTRYSHTYNCNTMEMVNKLDAIAAKYGLQLLDAELSFQRYQFSAAMEGLGLTTLLRQDAKLTMEDGQGDLRLPRNLDMETFVALHDREEGWAKDIYIRYAYADSSYFPGFGTATLDLSEYQQWKHTAPDGTALLLAMNTTGKGIILAERPDAMIVIQVDSNSVGHDFPKPEDVMDQPALEQIADAFDYSLHTRDADAVTLETEFAALQKAHVEKMQAAIPTYSNFENYLLENAHLFPTGQYLFCDLDGDGGEEMLIGGPGTTSTRILNFSGGEVHEHQWFGDIRVLEDGGLLQIDAGLAGDYSYRIYPATENGYPICFDYSGNGPELRTERWIRAVSLVDGVWKEYSSYMDTGTVISEAEAQAIIGQYPEKDASWQPVWDFPIDGQNIGQILEQRKKPETKDEYRAFYAQAMEAGDIWQLRTYTQYALRDVNRDGILDILLHSDGGITVFTWKYGKVVPLGSFTQLSGDNIYLQEYTYSAEDRAVILHYDIKQIEGSQQTELHRIEQNQASGQWTDLITGQPITQAEAEAILAQYPPVDIPMQPIGSLIP